ncbi:MAG: hypothetical protein AB7O98_13550 [Hyphomonadaceae bacterium]
MRLAPPALILWAALSVTATAQTLTAPIGPCEFSPAALAFRGDAREQARCLLRPYGRWAELHGELATLPPTLDSVVGRPFALDRVAVSRALVEGGVPSDIAGDAQTQVSFGGPERSIRARYLVLHDTSTPDLGAAPFPDNLDDDEGVNSFHAYRRRNAVAHAFVNRRGEIYVAQDFAGPLRATKLERAEYGGRYARGLFLHLELVQPRRYGDDDPGGRPDNHGIAPDVGFSAQQYRRAAQLYVLASARAGEWLIPGLHANVDRWIPDAHDDPQNFSLDAFDAALAEVIANIEAESATSDMTAASPSP